MNGKTLNQLIDEVTILDAHQDYLEVDWVSRDMADWLGLVECWDDDGNPELRFYEDDFEESPVKWWGLEAAAWSAEVD